MGASAQDRIDALAEDLYSAENQVILKHFNVARPLWWASREEKKREYRRRARALFAQYGER